MLDDVGIALVSGKVTIPIQTLPPHFYRLKNRLVIFLLSNAVMQKGGGPSAAQSSATPFR